MIYKDTSHGILRSKSFRDSIFYKAACDCGSDDCTQTLILEYDRLGKFISLDMYAKESFSSYYSGRSWVERFWLRVKAAFKILFMDYIDVEGDFVFSGEEHIQDYIIALQSGLEELKKKSAK